MMQATFLHESIGVGPSADWSAWQGMIGSSGGFVAVYSRVLAWSRAQ
jgi:hypothetical protein